MKWMIDNSAGKPDGVFTFAAISFAVVTICVILSFFDTLTIGSFSLKFRSPDATLLLGYLGSTYTAYVVRRNAKDSLLPGDSACTSS